MKKILLAIACISIMCSCGVTRYSQTTYLADYRTYTEDGFTITPSSSGFVYESIGEISIEFKIGEKKGYDNPNAKFGQEHVFTPSYDYMTAEMVKEAKLMGANAILNYNVQPIFGASKYGSYIIGYTVNGFAVKLSK